MTLALEVYYCFPFLRSSAINILGQLHIKTLKLSAIICDNKSNTTAPGQPQLGTHTSIMADTVRKQKEVQYVDGGKKYK